MREKLYFTYSVQPPNNLGAAYRERHETYSWVTALQWSQR